MTSRISERAFEEAIEAVLLRHGPDEAAGASTEWTRTHRHTKSAPSGAADAGCLTLDGNPPGSGAAQPLHEQSVYCPRVH